MIRPRSLVTDERDERLAKAAEPNKRLLVKRDRVVLPFVWRGLLPLIGLLVLVGYAIGPFARDGIEAQVHAETRSALDTRGLRWVELRVNGQAVHLSGTPPVPAAAEDARNVAAVATCGTWAGRRPCATEVWTHFNAPRTTNPAIVTPVAPAAPQTSAGASMPPIGVAAGPVAALPAPSKLAPVLAPAASAVASPVATSRECQQQIAQLLAQSRIQFDSGNAVIAAASQPLLDDLARAVRTCPGVVRIEGHTDDVGSAFKNQTLSLERAFAVRDALVARGLAPTQLVAQGFGSTKPLESNRTEKGRSVNRRIEFHVVPMPSK